MEKLESNLQKEPAAAKVLPVGLPKTTRIILEENDNIPPNGLYVGVNGKGYLLRPGEIINAPVGVIDVLDHAVQSKPVFDPQTRQVVGYRDSHKYSYRRVNEMSAAVE